MQKNERWLWDPGLSRLSLVNPPLIKRGLKDSKPRRANLSKLSATVMRQAAFQKKVLPETSKFFTDQDFWQHAELNELIRDVSTMSTFSMTVESLLRQLLICDDHQVFTAIGEEYAKLNDHLLDLSNVLVRRNPKQRQALIKDLMEVGAKLLSDLKNKPTKTQEKIIIQERPGKIGYLNIEETSVKTLQKKLQIIAETPKDKVLQKESLITVSDGWGFGCFSVEPAFNESQSFLNIACGVFEFQSKRFSIDDLDETVRLATSWLCEKTNVQFEKVDRLYLSCQSTAVASYFSEQFKAISQNLEIHCPDFIYGWSPTLSCIEMFSNDDRSLFVDLSRYPKVVLASKWNEEVG